MVTYVKTDVFRDVAPCRLVDSVRRFRGAWRQWHIALKVYAVGPSETLISIYTTIRRNISENSRANDKYCRHFELNVKSLHVDNVLWAISRKYCVTETEIGCGFRPTRELIFVPFHTTPYLIYYRLALCLFLLGAITFLNWHEICLYLGFDLTAGFKYNNCH